MNSRWDIPGMDRQTQAEIDWRMREIASLCEPLESLQPAERSAKSVLRDVERSAKLSKEILRILEEHSKQGPTL